MPFQNASQDVSGYSSMNRLDVLFIKDGTAWTAQCLQYDVSAQGESLKDAQRAFEYVLAVEITYLAKRGDNLVDCL